MDAAIDDKNAGKQIEVEQDTSVAAATIEEAVQNAETDLNMSTVSEEDVPVFHDPPSKDYSKKSSGNEQVILNYTVLNLAVFLSVVWFQSK